MDIDGGQILGAIVLLALSFQVSRTLKLPGAVAALRQDLDSLNALLPQQYVPRSGTRDDPGVDNLKGRVASLEQDHVGKVEFTELGANVKASREAAAREHREMHDSLGEVKASLEKLGARIESGLADARAESHTQGEILAVLREMQTHQQQAQGRRHWLRA